MNMSKDTWCPLPWMSLNVRNNGDVRVCCNANTSLNQGLVAKENGDYYNLRTDDVQSFRNAQLMKDIRKDILSAKYHPSCIRCQREDESGMESRRIWEARIWNNDLDIAKAREITNSDGSIDLSKAPLRYADLRFGNLCNLKCRMCGPTDSSQWYDDQVGVWGVDSYKDSGKLVKLVKNTNGKYKPEVDIYSWYENQEFWESLEKEIPNIKRLYIVGGEPLLIEQHYEFLNKCISYGRANEITVEYNSNLTNIPTRAWNIWKHFQMVQVGASIDGVGSINEYIRHPSKWSQIEANMRKLDNAEGNFRVWWAATIQAYNLTHLPDMMMWKIEQNFKRINNPKYIADRPIITPHPLHNPDFLNIKIFPEKSKLYIENYFNECKRNVKDKIYAVKFDDSKHAEITYNYFCKVLDNYLKYMKSDDYSSRLPKFWSYTNSLDELRQESLRDVSPITYELLTL